MHVFRILSILFLNLSLLFSSSAQKNQSSKYPSLMWEITGKKMTKPSYLFGTMHVSSKLAFHLSDSFYLAIKNCDAIALELNPQEWQPEMFRMEEAQKKYSKFTTNTANNYLTQNSFKLKEYETDLKNALSEAPAQVNSLLYRSYTPTADFEENTYLDLYIYQTGRKLGKTAAGVENFFETEKIIIEAYADMAKEKKKKKTTNNEEGVYEVFKKIQDAYKKGDLDLMDSLQKQTVVSEAFNEKFLYKRNEIQANSIDSIIKKQSLFVGVGAAHLPGNRGVIELLRKMGYTLRPVKMIDRDAEQKENIDKLKVPVEMYNTTTDDGFVQLRLPGKLYKRNDSKTSESWQYADMENGTYYMLSRVKTNAGLLLQNEAAVLKKIDSMLYENIPGKIIKKISVTKNNYNGYNILNRTRRGDLQRYTILIAPFEVLIFKMSGNDDYVSGKEGDDFFNSIQLNEQKNGWEKYEFAKGGFKVDFPHAPYTYFSTTRVDDIDTWQYATVDKNSGAAYVVWKKSVNNYSFLEEDTFDISLIEESFKKSDFIEKQINRKKTTVNGYTALEMQFSLKAGGVIKAKAFIKGPNYYLLAASSKGNIASTDPFFKSFTLNNFIYEKPIEFTDTGYNFSVQTPVFPTIDIELKKLFEAAAKNENLYGIKDDTYNYSPKEKIATFKNDTTGECVVVSVQTFAKYFYAKDTAKFWKNQINWNNWQDEFIVKNKEYVHLPDSITGYSYTLLDTNSSRKIKILTLLKDNKLFELLSLTDTLTKESSFIEQFYATFRPQQKKLGPSIFENKIDHFFEDYNSKDSSIKKMAISAIPHIYFGFEGFSKVKHAISQLKLGDKDYFDIKAKFIYELGYINDSCCTDKVVDYLKELYTLTADTSSFQNPIITSLVNLKTATSFKVVKDLLLQDPPVFEGDYRYTDIFELIEDSLQLAKTMFPEILQLTSLDDYKQPVTSLLRVLVDSGYLKSNDYETYFSKLYFDAKVELKKQQSRDEKIIEKENNKEDDGEAVSAYQEDNYNNSSVINDYAILLMPFYDKNPVIQKYFDKLLRSKDENLKMSTAILMLRNNKKVEDSIFEHLAAKDKFRCSLYKDLEKIKQLNKFPTLFNIQDWLAKSLLLNYDNLEKFFEIVPMGKQLVEVKNTKGYVYFFKYKFAKDDEWQIGISGIQPNNLKLTSSNTDLVSLSGKKITNDEPIMDQFQQKLKEMIFAKRSSAANFFENNRRYNYNDGDY